MPSDISFKAPGLHLLALETRLGFEALMARLARPLYARWPRGDGHPVMVLPGFGASDTYTRSLRHFLNAQGYEAHPWGLGFNLGRRKGLRRRMVEAIQALADRSGRSVSLVGWSLGGVFARGLAVSDPDALRSVITLGSPFLCGPESTNARLGLGVVSRFKGRPAVKPPPRQLESPEVPVTSIFSRTDGVVPWRATIQPHEAHTENICIPGSHLGILHNPLSRFILADRLSQLQDDWRPFSPPALLSPWLVPYHGGA